MRGASEQTRGAIWWSVGPIVDNTGGLASVLSSEYYSLPAATPVLADAIDAPPSHPGVAMDQGIAPGGQDVVYLSEYVPVGP